MTSKDYPSIRRIGDIIEIDDGLVITETSAKISEQYKGEWFMAITKYEQQYEICAEISHQGLIKSLQKSQEVFGSKFEILQIYEGVSDSGFDKLRKTARELEVASRIFECGKKVTLEKILE